MQVRWTKGRQLCYRDHIVNFPQNISEIATKLPASGLPEDVDMVIIRREDVDLTHHVNYVVRKDKFRAALYAPPSSNITDALSRDGSRLYQAFTQSFRLHVVHRQEGYSPEQHAFRLLLQHASSGGITMNEWKQLQTRAAHTLTAGDKASFDDATCLFTTREDVHALNMQEI